ncbi:uncharacterized protein LOC134674826 [Cydia fagiglandana]|uniref:uncharacterized protein LOC134674826 n=1 Tax=Cydia fagiglandana TaxID=1458189 RepID=UPI002FEE3C5B
MLFHALWSKLDVSSKEAFELQLESNTEIPSYEELISFIEKRSQALENSVGKSLTLSSKPVYSKPVSNKAKPALLVPPVSNCAMCSAPGHKLDNCTKFLELQPLERFAQVKERRLCILCCRPSHSVKNCKSSVTCGICKRRHHTLLHFEKDKELEPTAPPTQVALAVHNANAPSLFSTAIVMIKNKFNNFVPIRMLMDNASACNFVTLKCAQKLGIPIRNNSPTVNGVGLSSTDTFGIVDCEIVPSNGDSSCKFSFEAFVLPKICHDMPPEPLNVSSWRHLKDLDLADPSFHKSGPIDMLVNVNLFAAALQSGVVKGNADEPIAVRTVFGWLVMGECPINVNTSRSRCHKGSEGDTQRCYLVSSLSLDNNIKRFWELESVDPPKNIVLSKSEMSCENQMETSYCRTPEGRMVVPLTYVDPQDKPRFSNSREIALKRLLNLERKFKLNPQFRTDYVNFMDDYLSCGHMVEVDPPLSFKDQLHNVENVHDLSLSLKILGLSWLPKEDTFTFKTSLNDCRCTKRSILSDIARIFDPLGLLSPVVFFAKYLIQLLWVSGVDWDSEVPIAIAQEWRKFKSQLAEMSSLSIPRRMVVSFVSLQLHGYCDASEKGYCAVIYCRVVQNDGSVVVRLCCAKTKVAPLRKCSIPRCDLLTAVLLSDLIVSFTEALKDFHTFDDIHAWSDSTVALTWIRSCPSKWKTFVANRVAHIQENVPPENWHHVSGSDNPADCGSRGLLPADLIQNTLWWAGPTWLSNPQESWPQSEILSDQAASNEQKIYSLVTDSNISLIDNIMSRSSSLQRILRIFAYCFRFMHNLQKSLSKITDPNLSSEEITKVLHFLVKHVQERAFASELRCLLTDKSPHSLSKPMRKLAPFVDERGMLRVGGRLSKGDLSFDVKHPLLLPRDHRLTTLIIEDYHHRFMHPGLQTLQNLVAQEFWVLSARRAINSVISSCMKCFRARPKVASPPIMGNLPSFRINQIKPFSSAAVDYAGPFDTCLGRGRGLRTFKSYICVFVCTVTKAVHLELASELTTEAYLAALRRFISRRGRCSRLISDQGRNFIGASNMLQEVMAKASRAEQINFVFNPPGSPHFSGLAEAGVKSVKTHLARVVSSQRLTFEEFYTILTQIEAMLNSRPLSPVSSDPNDLSVLTPGHFLTLEPLTILPESNMVDAKLGPLQRWKLLQKIHQDFWRKWHLEYLHTLQQRHKWFDGQKNIVVGTLVLIVNEQCSPMKWKIGRVGAGGDPSGYVGLPSRLMRPTVYPLKTPHIPPGRPIGGVTGTLAYSSATPPAAAAHERLLRKCPKALHARRARWFDAPSSSASVLHCSGPPRARHKEATGARKFSGARRQIRSMGLSQNHNSAAEDRENGTS